MFNSYYEKIGEITKKIEVPFDIPSTWAWCRVSSISNFGENIIVNDEDIAATDWVLELEDIESYTSTLINKKSKGSRTLGSAKHKFRKGDLLLSKLRMYLKKVIIANEDGFCTTEILALNFEPFCLNEYACIYFISPYLLRKVEQLQYGCKMPRLGTKDGKELLMPLPPKNEQIRIVEVYRKILSNIDLLRDNYRDLQSSVDSLRYKILDIFFGADSRYKSYSENMQDLGLLVSGRDLTPDCYNSNNDGIPYLTGASNFEYDSVIVNRWTPKPVVISYNGDVLITCKGTIGKTAINQIGKCHIARQIMAFRCGEKLLPEYVKMFFDYRTQELQRASSSLIPGISRDIMLNMVIPLPSIETQDQIVKSIKTMFAQIERIVS
mgnify:CR=1 FL=1